MNKPVSGRIIGIDYGSKRVGVAISDEGRQFALPKVVIDNTSAAQKANLIEEVAKIAADSGATDVVVGESRNYAGEANTILPDILEFKRMQALPFIRDHGIFKFEIFICQGGGREITGFK